MPSTATSFEPAFIETPVYLTGHAWVMVYVAIADPS